MSGRIESFFVTGPAGRIECLLKTPAEGTQSRAAALVCHPHPLYGGTMHNKVVHAAAAALLRAGMPVLRFNFRGAGLSAGPHDEGRGETQDVALLLDALSRRYEALPIVVAGYSFGAYVGLKGASSDTRISALVAIGAPVALYDFGFLESSGPPIAFVHGDRDEFGPLDLLEALVASLGGRAKLLVVPGAAHDFAGKLSEVGQAVASAIPDALIARG